MGLLEEGFGWIIWGVRFLAGVQAGWCCRQNPFLNLPATLLLVDMADRDEDVADMIVVVAVGGAEVVDVVAESSAGKLNMDEVAHVHVYAEVH